MRKGSGTVGALRLSARALAEEILDELRVAGRTLARSERLVVGSARGAGDDGSPPARGR